MFSSFPWQDQLPGPAKGRREHLDKGKTMKEELNLGHLKLELISDSHPKSLLLYIDNELSVEKHLSEEQFKLVSESFKACKLLFEFHKTAPEKPQRSIPVLDKKPVRISSEEAESKRVQPTDVFIIDKDTAHIGPWTTIRACLDCGVLISGGPTRCKACVRHSTQEVRKASNDPDHPYWEKLRNKKEPRPPFFVDVTINGTRDRQAFTKMSTVRTLLKGWLEDGSIKEGIVVVHEVTDSDDMVIPLEVIVGLEDTIINGNKDEADQ